MEDSQVASNPVDRFLSFLSQNTTLLLFLLLGGTLLLRLKYMNVNAGLWWDEADYLRLAKHYAFGLPDIAAPYRERGMAIFYSVFYRLGANEWFIRFLEQLMSVVTVYFVYLIGKEFYGKKVGLVAGLMTSVVWVYIFWYTRISGELFMVAWWVMAAYLFWMGYVKKGKWWYASLAGLLVGFGTYAYSSMGLSLFFYLAFVLITERLGFLKNRRFWCAAVGALVVVFPFAIYSYESLGHVFPRFQRTMQADWEPLSEGKLDKFESGNTLNLFFAYWVALPGFLTWPFFILLVAGLLYVLGNIILGLDLLLKGQEPHVKKDLYLFLWAFSVLVLFSIIYTTTGFEFDPRFLTPMYPAVFIIAAKGLFEAYSFLKKYNKLVALAVVAGLLFFGVYSNIMNANSLIDAKKDSYSGEKEAGLWVRDNTLSSDVVLTCNQEVVLAYYTDRVTGSFGSNVTEADRLIDELKPKYVMLDIYHPDCAFDLAEKSSHKLVPSYVSFVNQEQKQPAVIVYSINY